MKGFNIELQDELFEVTFDTEDNNVHCLIIVKNPDDWYEGEIVFEGVAKLYPGDVFDLQKGQEIAFGKAFNKIFKAYERQMEKYCKGITKHANYVANGLITKFAKKQQWEKEQLGN